MAVARRTLRFFDAYTERLRPSQRNDDTMHWLWSRFGESGVLADECGWQAYRRTMERREAARKLLLNALREAARTFGREFVGGDAWDCARAISDALEFQAFIRVSAGPDERLSRLGGTVFNLEG